MIIYPLYVHHRHIKIKIYRHASLLYILSKIVKVCNADPEIPALFYIGDDNETLCYKAVAEPHIISVSAGFSVGDNAP